MHNDANDLFLTLNDHLVPAVVSPFSPFLPASFTRLLCHTAFWLVALFWITAIAETRMNFSGFNALFLLNLIRLPLLMGFVYLLSHRLVPELLLVRGWRAFLLPFSGSLLLIAFLDRLLMGSSLSDWATAGSDLTYVFWNWVPILRNTFVLLALAGAASLLKWRGRLNKVIAGPTQEESHSVVKAKFYSFKSGNEEIHLPLSAISHLSKEENYVIIHTEHRRFLVRTTLGALLDDLPAAEFLRVHRSYVVAVRHLRVVANQHVSLINGAVLPLSRMRKAAVRKALVQLPTTLP